MKMHRGMEDMEGMDSEMPMNQQETPMTEEGSPEGGGETISIPMEFFQGQAVKAGETINLKVVSVDNGNVEVEVAQAAPAEQGPPSADEEIDRMAAEEA